MAWSRGSDLMEKIIIVLEKIDDDNKEEIFYELIEYFHDELDCDDLDTCYDMNDVWDAAWRRFVLSHAEYFDDEYVEDINEENDLRA